MALIPGFSINGNALHVTRNYSEDDADAFARAQADAGSREFSGGCLDGRVFDLRGRTTVQPSILIVPQLTRNGVVYNQLPNTRTNFIPNNTMVGATGSVRPNLWDLGSLPSGFTVSYSASGQTTAADGTLVDYIDVTVSGTALASGFLNLRQTTSPSPVSGNLLFASGMTYTASVYLALLSGSLTGVATNAMALQEIANTTFVANTTFAPVTGITSALTRFSGTRPIDATGGADRVSVRWGHSITSGTSYDYTVRIASPQLEKGSIATPLIRTASGFVSVDALGVARDGAPPDFTFTRATTATRVNASGLIESVASGVLRLDYPVTGGCPAALIEPSGTNLALRSEEFDNASWSKTDITVTTGSTSAFTAPDGTTNADLFTSTASGSSFLAQTITIASGVATFSVFAKAGNHGIFRIGNVSSAARAAWFDLNAGAVIGTVNGGTASIQNYGSGWYRCIFTASSVVSGGSTFIIAISDAANGTASVSGATMYAWGAQLEVGSVATTYIPTTTASATRAADVISASGVSGYIGQTEGTIYAEVDIRNLTAGARIPFYLLNALGAPTDSVRIEFNNLNGWQATVRSNNANVFTVFGPTSQSQGIYKVALGYKSGDSALYINGTQAATNSSSFTFNAALVIAAMHGTSAGNNIMNDRIRAAAIYTTRLSNEQLESLTRLT